MPTAQQDNVILTAQCIAQNCWRKLGSEGQAEAKNDALRTHKVQQTGQTHRNLLALPDSLVIYDNQTARQAQQKLESKGQARTRNETLPAQTLQQIWKALRDYTRGEHGDTCNDQTTR